jgi:hypothetical protein
MTIEEILTAFAAGTYDQELAEQLLQGLVDEARQLSEQCSYASAALSGLLATGVRRPSMDDVAREAFTYAACMAQAAKQEPLPAGPQP